MIRGATKGRPCFRPSFLFGTRRPSTPRGRGRLALVFALSLQCPGTSRADESQPSASSVDLSFSERLELLAARERRGRLAMVVGGSIAAAVQLPIGVTLLTRGDPLRRQIGVGTVAASSGPIIMAFMAIPRGPLERLALDLQARRARGEEPASSDRAVRAAWKEAARAARERRRIAGATYVAFGLAYAITGAVFLLSRPGSLGLTEQAQLTVGSVFAGAGVPTVLTGTGQLLVPSLVETSWRLEAARDGRRGRP